MSKEYRIRDPYDVPDWGAIKAAADIEPDHRVVIGYGWASPLAKQEIANITSLVVFPYTIKAAAVDSFTIALKTDLH